MTHYTGDTVVVDAQDLVDDLRDEQDRIEAEEQRLHEDDAFDITDSEFVGLADDETAADVDDAEFREWLGKEWREREHTIDELETLFHEWGGSKFTIKHLTAGDTARIDDWTVSKAIAEDQTDPRTQVSASQNMTVAVGLTNTPGAPSEDKQDGLEYVRETLPNELVKWLYDRIESLTNYGEAELDDFSPFPDRSGDASAPN
jgi:hypothetical protein